MSEVAIAGITGFSILGVAIGTLIYKIFGADSESVYHSKVAHEKAVILNDEVKANTGSGRRSRKSRRSRRSAASRSHAKHWRRR
jgi:hypothetical protein